MEIASKEGINFHSGLTWKNFHSDQSGSKARFIHKIWTQQCRRRLQEEDSEKKTQHSLNWEQPTIRGWRQNSLEGQIRNCRACSWQDAIRRVWLVLLPALRRMELWLLAVPRKIRNSGWRCGMAPWSSKRWLLGKSECLVPSKQTLSSHSHRDLTLTTC